MSAISQVLPLTLDSARITAWLGAWLWPLFRIASALWIMPIFGGSGMTARVRMALAVSLTLLIVPSLGAMPVVDPLSPAAVVVTVQQVTIGLAFGMVLKLWLAAFTMAGQIMSMQMGLAMAVMNDPVNGPGTAILGMFLQMIAILVFLAMDGHLVVFSVLLESFRTLPVGTGLLAPMWMDLVKLGSWLFASSLLVALPMVISMLVVNMAFGVMNRAAPQLNIIALGFPMTMIFGMVTVLLSMSGLPGILLNLTSESLGFLRMLVNG